MRAVVQADHPVEDVVSRQDGEALREPVMREGIVTVSDRADGHISIRAHLHVAVVESIVQGNLTIPCVHHGEALKGPPVWHVKVGILLFAEVHVVRVHVYKAPVICIVQGHHGAWLEEGFEVHDAEALPKPRERVPRPSRRVRTGASASALQIRKAVVLGIVQADLPIHGGPSLPFRGLPSLIELVHVAVRACHGGRQADETVMPDHPKKSTNSKPTNPNWPYALHHPKVQCRANCSTKPGVVQGDLPAIHIYHRKPLPSPALSNLEDLRARGQMIAVHGQELLPMSVVPGSQISRTKNPSSIFSLHHPVK